ncbi:dihydropteroate synthase [Jongsikchunia kroppenstedtii]|uniref:dihydropteroate synthase n=1 Tax=Jongsikchunia kroppenstedtii TaxID=1121721 RepID=UPI00047782C4|nr:dihydropteroate synthase [Jongsikchunia kroppenstedtii]
MGVVNVTADSFSDGGRYLEADAAIAHGVQLVRDGADIVDVGGESTRPGAARVPAEVEQDRVVPVVKGLVAAGITVSVDTMRASVAEAAIEAGASIVNDVTGGGGDPDMAKVVGASGVQWILMHWRALGGAEYLHSVDNIGGYRDVVAEVSGELLGRVYDAVEAGVDPERLILDPGLGFAKAAEHNWALLHELPTLVGLGFPILIGASRKRFLGSLLADENGPRPPAGREVATAVVSALAAEQGAWGVRVHDVRSTADAIAVTAAWADRGRRGRVDG